VLAQREHTIRIATMSVAEGYVRRFRPTALAVGAFFSLDATYGFSYYYFAGLRPALLPAGWG